MIKLSVFFLKATYSGTVKQNQRLVILVYCRNDRIFFDISTYYWALSCFIRLNLTAILFSFQESTQRSPMNFEVNSKNSASKFRRLIALVRRIIVLVRRIIMLVRRLIALVQFPWRRRGSVGSGAGLVIERLQNLSLTPDALRVAVSLEKTLNAISHLGAKQSTRCGD